MSVAMYSLLRQPPVFGETLGPTSRFFDTRGLQGLLAGNGVLCNPFYVWISVGWLVLPGSLDGLQVTPWSAYALLLWVVLSLATGVFIE